MRSFFRWAFDDERERRLSVLAQVPLFKGLGRRFLGKMLTDLVLKEDEEREVVFSEGDLGMAVYIVIEGSVTISKKSCAGEKVLARIGPGSHFGELALIDHGPRFASAAAGERALLLIMYRSYFDSLLQSNHVLSSRIQHNLLSLITRYVRRDYDLADGSPDAPADA